VRLTRYARPAAYILLAIVTVWGVYGLIKGDPGRVIDYWKSQLSLLPLILLMACLDVALEGVGWLWVYARMGIRGWDSGGARAYLAGRAGLLMPAQLGRLIRPDVMARLNRGPMSECLKAEAVTFVLDATSVMALLVGLVAAYTVHWAAAPVAGAAVLVAVLFLGNRISKAVSGTRLALPARFWWSWQTVGIVLVEMLGWVAHGIALWLMIRGLSENATPASCLFYSCASSVFGAGTGLPGGIGATELMLGGAMKLMMNIQQGDLFVPINAFRLVTFWMWIPIGWLALLSARRRAATLVEESRAPTVVPAD
jgi:hypothetical protein